MSGITNPAESYFKDGIWGWDGSRWRKLPMLFGYSEPWRQIVTATAVGAGDAFISTTAVAAGYVYVLQHLSAFHDAGVNKDTSVWTDDGSVQVTVLPRATTTTGIDRVWGGEMLFTEGDVVTAFVAAPGAGKKIYLSVWGYKMKVAE